MNPTPTIKILAISLVISVGFNLVRAEGVETTAKRISAGYPELAGLVRVYFVSPTGDDRNTGTADKPFRTISHAAKILLPGEGVFVRAGTYRERVAPKRGGEPGRPVVYFAEPAHQAVLKGSDVWQPMWNRVAERIYSAVPDEAMFTDDAYWDNANPLRVTVSATPWGREGRAEYDYLTQTNPPNVRSRMNQSDLEKLLSKCDTNLVFTLGQLFVDGTMFRQMPYRGEMEAAPASWFYDSASGRVFVHFADELPPERHEVELTTRRRIFAPHKRGLGYLRVIGFVMEHCGNQYPKDFWSMRENGQAGALGTRAGHHWLIRDNIIRFATGFGLDIGTEGIGNERNDERKPVPWSVGHHVIEDNQITDNGAGGICGMLPEAVTLVNNVIERNNNLRFKGAKRWESAGIKLHEPDHSLVANNLLRDNYTHGFWSDQGIGKGLRFTRNIIIGNDESEHGVFIEMGEYGPNTGLIDNNIIVGNRNGIYCHDGSGMTAAHNLIANSREFGIQVRQVSPRCNTRNNAFFNNLLIGNSRPINLNYPAELGGDVRLDGNVYSGSETDRTFVINPYSKFDPSWTQAEFTRLIQNSLAPAPLDGSAVAASRSAALTFDEWKSFWSKYSTNSDERSKMAPRATVQLDSETLALTLFVPVKLSASDIRETPQITNDFFGRPYSKPAAVGPFVEVATGTNFFQLPEPRRSRIAGAAAKASLNAMNAGSVGPADFSRLSGEAARISPDTNRLHGFPRGPWTSDSDDPDAWPRRLHLGGNTAGRGAGK